MIDQMTNAPPGVEQLRRLDEFEATVAEVCGQLHYAHARLVALTADALEQRWWAQSGIRSPEHWLCWQTGVSPHQAARIVAVARRRDELPVTMTAFDAGELSLDQVAVIVAHAPGWADTEVCSLATRCTVAQIRAVLGRYPFTDPDPEPEPEPDAGAGGVVDDEADEPNPDDPPPEQPPAAEFVRFADRGDGTWRLSGRVDADHALVIDAALREITDALFRESGRGPTGVEVLTEMARRSLDQIPDRSRRDRYRVHVLLDERRQLLDPLGHCLPAWLRDLITCDTTAAVTWTRNGAPIAQGSTADTIPAATRRHVLARDHGCRVPGCGHRRRLDIHHVVHRHRGGTNDPHNLIALCPHHHRMHHRGHLGITGNADDPDGIIFTNSAGRPITTNRLIRPPTQPPPPAPGGYRHPLGEHLQRRWIHFNPPDTHRDHN